MSKTDYTLPDIHHDFVTTKQNIDYTLFRNLCEEFNERVMEELIYNGRTMNMGAYLSNLDIRLVDRNYSKKVVNWDASNKLKQELLAEGKELYSKDNPDGEKWLVYHSDPWYIKFHWYKKNCKVKNKSVYKFKATRGKKGNKTKLKELLNNDELAYLKFKKLNTN